jgi:hypothetical protein
MTQLTKLQKERAAFELEEIGFVSYPRESAFIGGPKIFPAEPFTAASPVNPHQLGKL